MDETQQPELLPKDEVNYSVGGEDALCGSCTNFISPKSCKLVEGDIASNGTCDLYAGKESDLATMLFGGTPSEQ